MAWIILVLMITFPALGGYYVVRGRAKSLDRLKTQVEDDMRNRLMLISQDVMGNIIDGPGLETLKGQMSVAASKAPASMVIDVAKFTAKVPLDGALTVVRVGTPRRSSRPRISGR